MFNAPRDLMPLILVVDDTPQNLVFISDLLRNQYRVRVAPNGLRALAIAKSSRPDLVLLDIKMPDMDGYEVCKCFKSDPDLSDIPIIFLTSLSEADEQTKGLTIGAADYVIKPIAGNILMARVKNHLQLKAAADFLRDKSEYLEQEVRRRIDEVLDVQDVTINALAALAEARDNETGHHILRTQRYVKTLAMKLALNPKFTDVLNPATIELLYKSAPLHDIGKVGIPDAILLKPSKLTAEEFEIMKTHTTLGYEALSQAERRLGKPAEFLRFAKEIAYSHQEKWDGSGYPKGLSGQNIPLSARLMAIADVYDALISKRVYKEAMSHDEATGIVLSGAGTHFDPELVEAFNELHEEFRRIACEFSDEG